MLTTEIQERIQALPSGGLTKKKINGREYIYYQWTENKKQHSRSVSRQEAEALKNQIEERDKQNFEEKMPFHKVECLFHIIKAADPRKI